MHSNSGKGDSPRNCFSNKFRSNYDDINWGRPKTIDEVFDVPKGTFQRKLKESENVLTQHEQTRQKRIKKANANKPATEPVCDYCGRIYCDCDAKY